MLPRIEYSMGSYFLLRLLTYEFCKPQSQLISYSTKIVLRFQISRANTNTAKCTTSKFIRPENCQTTQMLPKSTRGEIHIANNNSDHNLPLLFVLYAYVLFFLLGLKLVKLSYQLPFLLQMLNSWCNFDSLDIVERSAVEKENY